MITPRSFLHGRTPTPPSSPSRSQISVPAATIKPRSSLLHKHDGLHGYLFASDQVDATFDDTLANCIPIPRVKLSHTDGIPSTTNPSNKQSPFSTTTAKTKTTMATAASTTARPMTPSSAVQIPVRQRKKDGVRRGRSSSVRRTRDIHSPDAIPPSVAALLALTNIPPPSRRRNVRQRENGEPYMTVDSIVPRSRVSEKELSQELRFDLNGDLDEGSSLTSLGRSPLDFLLTPPGEFEEEGNSVQTDSGFTSPYSTRTGSFDSLPSLGHSLSPNNTQSDFSPVTPRGGKFRSPKRSLEPVTTPPGELPEDPLSKARLENESDGNDFNGESTAAADKQTQVLAPFKLAFKSNLTASLRALRSAARSLSSFTASSIPPDDLLTRSILTIDSRVPFTDERRPPVLEEEPSEAMRRYLNPASNVRPEVRGSTPTHSYTASIQMQTYRVQRSRAIPRTSRQTANTNSGKTPTAVVLLPTGPRQREMRENPDFIRIAVMEHLMRKRGKLDDQREGHARWLLPPRKATTKPYEIGPGGVPVRWVPTSQGD
ncbi:hypothetical protein GGS20DRAFT_160021 [Poronia punctata]|nr:hypothetical protein GGS20DRAFT_160021 [Poronia punctata]